MIPTLVKLLVISGLGWKDMFNADDRIGINGGCNQNQQRWVKWNFTTLNQVVEAYYAFMLNDRTINTCCFWR